MIKIHERTRSSCKAKEEKNGTFFCYSTKGDTMGQNIFFELFLNVYLGKKKKNCNDSTL